MSVSFLAAILILTNQFGSVTIDSHGARVLSYVPSGSGEDVLVTLPSGCGGIPLCWPWFQYNGPEGWKSPKHGLARYRDFTIVGCTNGTDMSEAVMRLKSDAETRRFFPHEFTLTVAVKLSVDGLSLEMTGENTGRDGFPVTEAFHPYLRRSIAARLKDDGTGTFRTWNPDATSHLKTTGLEPDSWKLFLCRENGTFSADSSYILAPGEKHVLRRRLNFNWALEGL